MRRETHTNPVKVRDAETRETTRFCIHGNAGPSDNPMQSEISGHIGPKGNYGCRKCEAGGCDKDKETDECFHSLFYPGIPRDKDKILTSLQKQVKLACAGVAQPIKNMQRDSGIKDAYTQHWIDHILAQFKEKKEQTPNRSNTDIQKELVQWTLDNEDKIYSGFLTLKGFDPTKDTPVEILHTILLGVVKLQSTNTNGLSIHAIRANYIMQYANSLIGRQLKTLSQVNIFHVRGLVSEEHFAIWRAVGEFAALMWVPEIHNLDEYLSDLRIAAGNVLDSFAVVDPTKILTKIKLHLIAHTPEDVVAFGPLVGMITEGYEAFNAVFRFCSILSNHLAPSRDIALQLADQEALKHRLTGGWWPNTDGEWERAGPGVRAFLETRPTLQRLVGWTKLTRKYPQVDPWETRIREYLTCGSEFPTDPSGALNIAGSVKLVAWPKRQKGVPKPTCKSVALSSTNAAQALNKGDYDLASQWFPCREIITAALDECERGSWVFVKSPITDKDSAVIILDVFQISETRDDIYGMPILVRRQSETTFVIVPAREITFQYNTQHDCHAPDVLCEATGERSRMQERVDSGITEKYIVHKPVERFILNTHAFHNAHLVRQVLPRALVAPIALFLDRKTVHYEQAARLREIKSGKRKRAQEKRAAAKKAKDAKAAAAAAGAPVGGAIADDSSEDSESSDFEEEERRPRKRQRRKQRRLPDSDSEDDYDGGQEDVNPTAASAPPRTSGRARTQTARAQAMVEQEAEADAGEPSFFTVARMDSQLFQTWGVP
ncbi:hypothetical protein DFH06DRAFT_1417140 [Mycena polygramma]|nr:hypothetical protein DFH06DRAFT_1417140 [Mycena polygramma]